MKSLLIGIVVGILLMGSVTFANDKLNITNPVEDSITGSDIVLEAVSKEYSSCYYKLDKKQDESVWIMMQNTGGKSHTQPINDLSNGEHKVHVHCCTAEDTTKGCEAHGENEHVEWEVSEVSVPEYPSAIIPALLSIASFGLVSFKMR